MELIYAKTGKPVPPSIGVRISRTTRRIVKKGLDWVEVKLNNYQGSHPA